MTERHQHKDEYVNLQQKGIGSIMLPCGTQLTVSLRSEHKESLVLLSICFLPWRTVRSYSNTISCFEQSRRIALAFKNCQLGNMLYDTFYRA